MKRIFEFICFGMLSTKASSNGIPVSRKTNVVNQAFCDSSLPPEDKMGKKTLEEVHTYAELKHNPHASLPESFTVCSTIMTPDCPNQIWPAFFSILDSDMSQFLAPICKGGSILSSLKIFYQKEATEAVAGKIPSLFPNQWTKSCMAINTTSGLIHWVVEGTLVLTTTSEEVKKSRSQRKNLSKRIVLGARAYAGIWFPSSSKVTNLNIFSSSLSIERR